MKFRRISIKQSLEMVLGFGEKEKNDDMGLSI